MPTVRERLAMARSAARQDDQNNVDRPQGGVRNRMIQAKEQAREQDRSGGTARPSAGQTAAGAEKLSTPKWTQVQADWQSRHDGNSLLREAAQEVARGQETADVLNQAALQKQLKSLQSRQSELTAGLDLNGAGELQTEIDSLKKQINQARRAEEVKNQTPSERLLKQLQGERTALEAGLDLTGAAEVQNQIDSLKEQIWQEELAASGGRRANLWDITGGSILRGYQNSVYGQESYQEMLGRKNQAQEKAQELSGEKYNFVPKGTAAKGISGAAELLGQQVRQWTDPDSLILGGAAAAAAGIAGQMGPQVLAPEEIITMPSAFLTGMQMGSAKVNFEIEAGLAYQEMIENGISRETASKVASVVGLGNAALELVQMDELVKSFRILNKSGGADDILQAIGNELVERGLDVAKETAQEVAQEGVTITGSQIANQLEKGQWAYGGDEVLERLGDTALSSALSFGVLNIPGGAYNVRNAARGKMVRSSTNEAAPPAGAREMQVDPGRAEGLLMEAAGQMAQEGKVTNRTAERILSDQGALDKLTEASGMAVDSSMTKSQQREAVKSAVGALAGYRESAESVMRDAARQTVETARTETKTSGPPVEKQEYDLRRAERAAAVLGERGSRAFTAAYDRSTAESVSLESAFEGFAQVYNAALDGREIPETPTLPEHLRYAAESAGQADALGAEQAKYFGENAGLVRDNNWKRANLRSRDSRVLDAVAKAAGVQVRFDEQVADGRANAQYDPASGVITIALDAQDPVRTAFTHEIVHRIRHTSPEAYTDMARFVQANMGGEALTFAEAERAGAYQTQNSAVITEELVADAFGRMLGDSKVLEQFVTENRTVAQRVLDAVHDLAAAVKRALNGQNVKLTEEQRSAFRDLEKDLTGMERLLSDALESTARKTESLSVQDQGAHGTMETAKFSLKEGTGYDQNGQGQETDTRTVGESEEGRQFLREAAERGQVGRSFEAWQSKAGQRESRLGRFTEVTDSERSEKAAATQTELEALGIPAFVHAGDLEVLTSTGQVVSGGDAAVVNHSQVGINNNIDLPPRETAGHEAFHFWSNTSECTQYQDIIRAGVKWTSSEFVTLYDHINENYFDGKLNLSHEDELEHFFEEFYAYISGYIHNGEDLSGLLSNFQEVKAAWEALVEQESGQKEGKAKENTKFSLKEDGQVGGEGIERTGRVDEKGQGWNINQAGGDSVRYTLSEVYEGEAIHGGSEQLIQSASFGEEPIYRWVSKGSIVPKVGTVAQTEQHLATEYGIPSFVVSDIVWNETRGEKAAPAFSAGGQIFLRETLPEQYRGTFVSHEMTHVMKQLEYQPYMEFIRSTPDRLDMKSRAAQRLLDGVGEHRGIDPVNMSEIQRDTLYDELNATIYGAIASGDSKGLDYIRPAFYDFDAYTAELTAIHKQFKESRTERGKGKNGPKFSIKTPDGRELSVDGAEYAGAYTQAEQAEAKRLWKHLGTESPYFKRFYDGNTPELYEGDGSPRVVYHGTADQITQFEKAVRGSFTNARDAKMGFFFSSSQRVAQGYAKNTFPYEILKLMKEFDRLEALLGTNEEVDSLYKRARDIYEEALLRYKKSGAAGVIIRAFLSMKNPLVVDYHSATYREDIGRYADFIQQAAAEGRDGVVFKNTYDGFYSSDDELSDIFVVFEPGQIKSAEENMGTFDKADPDIRHSLKGTAELEREIGRLIQEGKRTGRTTNEIAAEIQATALEAYRGQIEEYGAIKPGERPARQVQTPRRTAEDKKVSQTVRTVLEAGATPDEVVPTIQELTARGAFSYEVFGDKAAIAQAEGTIRSKGYATALSDWTERISKGEVSKKNTALGWALYNQAANAGDLKTAMTVLTKMIGHQRNAAQAVQATRILKQMSPEGQLYGVQRSVENLREELEGRYGDKAPDLQINEGLARELLEARDQKAREEALKNLYRDIGRQMPSRFVDKWNAWRYLAMLGNPRTHVRNIVGNAGFMPVVAAKDLTATAIEGVVYRVSSGRLERTKGAVGPGDRALLAAAWGDYGSIQDQALGGGKYSDFSNANRSIEEGRVIFQNKILEGARKANSAALDAEDMWFSKPHYAYALAQYCKANHITAEQVKAGKGLERARSYAVKEAQKATYRDTNAFSNFVSKRFSERGQYGTASKMGNIVLSGILPFRKTPANILARGVEYSPAGLLKGLFYDLNQVRQGNMTGAEAIDNISAGLTGTGLLALGIYLASQGLVRGSGGDDEDKKKFEELMGHQAYSLELTDGTSVTLDWLAPECLPFFVGVNLWEQTQGEGEPVTMSELLTATANVTEPLLEMSCLQSLNDVFDAVGYASSDGLDGLPASLASAATSYLTQAFPTLLGQAERTGQKERMTTYTEKNAFLTSDMQYTLGRISGRAPGWDYQQIPYIDAWGRSETEESVTARAAGNFLNPAYTSKVESSPLEDELLRLYKTTGEAGVLPQRAGKYFTVDGERKDLSAEEYVRYAAARGQTAYRLLTGLTDSQAYRELDDAGKAEAVGKVYEYADAAAKAEVSSYRPGGWVGKAFRTVEQAGVPAEQYISLYLAQKGVESLKGKDGETIPNSRSLLVMELVYQVSGLTDKQRRALFEDFGVGSSVLHYNKALVREKLKEMERRAG